MRNDIDSQGNRLPPREDTDLPIGNAIPSRSVMGGSRVWKPRRRFTSDGREMSVPNPNVSTTSADTIGFDADPFERLAQMRKQRRRGIVEGASFTQGRA